MIKILRKMFIKNHDDIKSEEVRMQHGVFASIFGIILNLLLFVLKLIFGILSNSISIIGDAINNLTDLGSSIITFIGFKLSNKPADEEHPYGHQRIEYITSLIISIIIIVVGIELFSTSITKIINNDQANYSYVTLIVLIISLFAKLYLAYFNKSIGKTINSNALLAVGKDAINDVVSTFFILISAVLSILFNLNLDGIMGIVVACFICFSGISLVKETIDPLIGEKVDNELVKKILQEIDSEENILGYHDVMCHCYGPTKIFMSLHAEVDSSKDIIFLHEIIDNIELLIKQKYNIELVIHMDPCDLSCERTKEYKAKVKEILAGISSKLSFHDFRIINGEKTLNLIFDVVVPHSLQVKKEDIINTLNYELKNDEVNIKLIISIDSDFTY